MRGNCYAKDEIITSIAPAATNSCSGGRVTAVTIETAAARFCRAVHMNSAACAQSRCLSVRPLHRCSLLKRQSCRTIAQTEDIAREQNTAIDVKYMPT